MREEESDSLKIARIDEWAKQHTKEDDKREKDASDRFERVFKYLEKQFIIIGARFDGVESKMQTLWDEKNVRDGEGKNKSRSWSAGDKIINILVQIVIAVAAVKALK